MLLCSIEPDLMEKSIEPTMQPDSFFINSIEGEPSYVNTRDMECERALESRKFIEHLWSQYKKHADINYKTDAPKHFQQRFWEMYLGVTLENIGFKINKATAKGPEYFVQEDSQIVWFEAIAPTQGTGKDAVPDLEDNIIHELPEDKIILRFTHSIYEKHKQYEKHLSANTIGIDDSYVIAINSKGIRFFMGEQEIPFIVKSVLPFGNAAAEWSNEPGADVKFYHSYRDEVIKENNSRVSTSMFLNKQFSGISAILCSSVSATDHNLDMGADFTLVHNPYALNPLKKGFFTVGVEYWLDRNMLKKTIW